MKRYRVTYKQSFNGDVLTDSYIKSVRSDRELIQSLRYLYADPHVFSVDWEEIK